MKKIFFLLVGMCLVLTSCSVSVDDSIPIDKMYSRSNVKEMTESIGFGKGSLDDEYVACIYVYSSEELKNIYGSNFELKYDDITCVLNECETYFLKSIYKGISKYDFNFDNKTYEVTVEKKYFGKWEVTNAEWI